MARALYERVPDAAQLSAIGLRPEDIEQTGLDVWPDNLAAVNVFIAMATQWRIGFGGATGLDYAALPAVLEFLNVPTDKHRDIFEDVRVMEAEALSVMREKNNG